MNITTHSVWTAWTRISEEHEKLISGKRGKKTRIQNGTKSQLNITFFVSAESIRQLSAAPPSLQPPFSEEVGISMNRDLQEKLSISSSERTEKIPHFSYSLISVLTLQATNIPIN